MLRLIVLVLILANGGYFLWTRANPRVHGFGPVQQAEPEHLTQQIHPDAVRVLSKDEVKRIEAQARADAQPKACLQAGPFTDTQIPALRSALMSIMPVDSWEIAAVKESARWLIYMGRYANAEAADRKRAQLSALGFTMEPLNSPELEFGLSLGSFSTQEAADAQFARLRQQGLRTGRVLLAHPEQTVKMLKLPAVSDVLQQSLGQLKPALAGKPLKPCHG